MTRKTSRRELQTHLESRVREHPSRVGDVTRLVNLLQVELLREVTPKDLREHGLGEIDELASLEVGHHVGIIRVLIWGERRKVGEERKEIGERERGQPARGGKGEVGRRESSRRTLRANQRLTKSSVASQSDRAHEREQKEARLARERRLRR